MLKPKLKLITPFLRFFIFGNIAAITLSPFGIYFDNEKYMKDKYIVNHEKIHWKQQLEMLIIFFYIWYILEFIIRIFINGNNAYRKLSFEQEAYDNDNNLLYLENRKHYAWIKYLFK